MNKFYTEQLEKLNFKKPTKIQELTFDIFETLNTNLVIKAPTGTGKTLSYLLPLKYKYSNSKILILLPTLELTRQVYLIAKDLFDTDVLAIDANTRINSKIDQNIIISTPSKIVSYINRGTLDIREVDVIVFDEADMLFSQDFLSDMVDIIKISKTPRLILASATIDQHMKPFIKQYFGAHTYVSDKQTKLNTKYYLLKVAEEDRLEKLVSLISSITYYTLVIFVSKNENQETVCKRLLEIDKSATVFNSYLDIRERKRRLTEILDNKYKIIITSDVMSRGIDFKNVDIINYDMPTRLEYFVHRAGRTGRAESDGHVYSIVTEKDSRKIQNLRDNKKINFIRIKIVDGEIDVIQEKNPVNDLYITALKKIKKPVKVKPNYKKKNKELIAQQFKKEKSKMYRENYRKGSE